MAVPESTSSISLRGEPGKVNNVEPGRGSAILLKLGDNILQGLRKSSQTKDALSFVAGSVPVSGAVVWRLGRRY